jgi:LacI family transcriptional regulator
VDADHFKLINDTLGHQQGDAALQAIAETIRSSVRSTDLVGRIGGEEFGIFLPGANPQQAAAVAEKIRAIALSMNYRTNQIARSLKTNKTYTIGLILADISNPFSAALARYIEDEADRHGYTVIFGSSDEKASKSERLLSTFLNRQVDGLIISPPAGSEEQILRLKKQQVPLVLLDRYFPGIETNHVSVDNYAAAFEATDHLLSIGRKKIAMIAYRSTLFNLEQRVAGYKAALKKAKLPFDKNLLQYVDIVNDRPELEKATSSLLEVPEPADAILFGSNRIAAGSLKFINTLPVKVPEQLSLVGFDETELFDFFHAPLTYVQQPVAGMGALATKILLENIEKKKQEIITKTGLSIKTFLGFKNSSIACLNFGKLWM